MILKTESFRLGSATSSLSQSLSYLGQVGPILPHLQNGAQNWMAFSRGVSASVKLDRQRDKAGLGLRRRSLRAQCPACGRCSCCCPALASSWPQVWAREREAFICHVPQPPSGLTTTTVVSPGPRELRHTQAGEHPCFCLFQNWCKPQGPQHTTFP